ncbi:phosphohistidine phosphatase SixA [Limnobaculum zhutongyuii]|uniref:Phosphohistidine phosphatase SixA n=1 Tax=Limnobaculum zhutongyuii TaxID=2498113 RepID=A0A411WL90_9GAMM|nr:phosphohistidine phosphatase SixA [Limnobaculum zhutongyuii]QBH96999.1 phosphohistidine phosphatase SixA [Limnobaculum zhutongyuii]TQS87451.1 phosphohistidine phosphatase SixA [Limnobaculum zhutongyuii]
MQVFIMRHGEASYHADSDPARNLTERGCKETAQMTRWLRQKIAEIDWVLVSPYVRAQQTLDVVKHEFPLSSSSTIETFSALTPGGDAMLSADYLMTLAQDGVNSVLVVSHLPLVGYLVSELCGGIYPPMFSTSAVAAITLDAETGRGSLDWQQTPGSLS